MKKLKLINNYKNKKMNNNIHIKRVLISVYDKENIVDFAYALYKKGIEIISTNGTANLLIKNNIKVTKVSEYIGLSEMMDGRLKTLHYKIFGGILSRKKDNLIMEKNNILSINMVVVNFYPINTKHKKKFIENIDIGGPTLVRAAAKNYNNVIVVVNKKEYTNIINEININNCISIHTSFNFAMQAFKYIAIYDYNISNNFINLLENKKNLCKSEKLPNFINLNLIKIKDIKYGENMHQKAAFYLEKNQKIYLNKKNNFKKLQGKELSYNNIIDIEFALDFLKDFNELICVIIKHSNPCSVSTGSSIIEAYEKAYFADPISSFGGILAFNRKIHSDTIKNIINNFRFFDIIIFPDISKNAFSIIQKKPNMRIVLYKKENNINSICNSFVLKNINDGFLLQEKNNKIFKNILLVSKRNAKEKEIQDSIFAWKIVKHVKSNAIVLVKNKTTLGIGAGQMSRIDSTKIAIKKAQELKINIKNSVMASDAFFPFRDNIDIAAQAGIKCIIQPGGSIRDKSIISAIDENSMSMFFTNIRHFRH